MDAILVYPREDIGAAGHINFAVGNGSRSSTAPGRHGREFFPLVSSRVVFPDIVDWRPAWRPCFGKRETAEAVNFVVQACECDMVRGKPHWPLLGPLIRGRVILEHQCLWLPAGCEAAKDIEFSARSCSEDFLRRIREWRPLYPGLSRGGPGGGILCEGAARCDSQHDNAAHSEHKA
jgi:hypothetical protein